MLSISQKKLIRALGQKKQRDLHGLFVIEGSRIIIDLLQSGELHQENTLLIAGTPEWVGMHAEGAGELKQKISTVPGEELRQVSSLQSPPEVIAVVRKPGDGFSFDKLKDDITLVFDRIRDPGNLGTVIRTADWFGMGQIVCSSDSVDCFNGKVVQSTMGGIMRVGVHYTELDAFLSKTARMKIPVYGTVMDGEDLYETTIKSPSLIMFGNEATGIAPALRTSFRSGIRIPGFPPGHRGSESLNVAASVAVVCAELRRRQKSGL